MAVRLVINTINGIVKYVNQRGLDTIINNTKMDLKTIGDKFKATGLILWMIGSLMTIILFLLLLQ